MAVRNDIDNASLVPFDDRYPGCEKSLRNAAYLTDDQFALFAAEWADGLMEPEMLDEMDTAFRADPRRKDYAARFMKIKLKPGEERWINRDTMLKHSRILSVVRTGAASLLAAAALIAAFLLLKPMVREALPMAAPTPLHRFQIAAATPVTRTGKPDLTERHTGDAVAVIVPAETGSSLNLQPRSDLSIALAMNPAQTPSVLTTQPGTTMYAAVPFLSMDNNTDTNEPDKANWMVRSLVALTAKVRKDKAPLDGFMIANACVKSVNSVLGWEMELEKVLKDNGETVAVNFSSSLLSFRTPVKKNNSLQ